MPETTEKNHYETIKETNSKYSHVNIQGIFQGTEFCRHKYIDFLFKILDGV